MKYIERTYYTLSDLGITEMDMLNKMNGRYDFDDVPSLPPLLLERFKRNWAMYYDRIVDDSEPTQEILPPPPELKEEWLERFGSKAKEIEQRYNTMFHYYFEYRHKLMDKINTTSKTRFNDTPQESDMQPTDGYATNITTHTVDADTRDNIERLKSIHDDLVNVVEEWINEFKFLFGEKI